MFKNESDFTRWFCEQLTRAQCRTVALVGGEMQEPGLPDRWVALGGGESCWLEFKSRWRAVTKKQGLFLREMVRLGVPAFVVRLMDERTFNVEDPRGFTLATTDIPKSKTRYCGQILRETLQIAIVSQNKTAR